MDLGNYIKRSGSYRGQDFGLEKRCHNCGDALENDGSHLYYQRFCSLQCKRKYTGMDVEE